VNVIDEMQQIGGIALRDVNGLTDKTKPINNIQR